MPKKSMTSGHKMISPKERKLIVELRKDSRQDITGLAKVHNYPKSTMYDILHKLEEKGILNHKSFVDFEKLGFPLQVFVVVKTSAQYKEKMREFLKAKKNINTIYTVNSSSNFHFECIFRNQKEIEDFLEELEDKHPLNQISVYNVIERICIEKFLTQEDHFE
jgi:DNA-binding Lrp family transcriptional regulator